MFALLLVIPNSMKQKHEQCFIFTHRLITITIFIKNHLFFSNVCENKLLYLILHLILFHIDISDVINHFYVMIHFTSLFSMYTYYTRTTIIYSD